MPGRDVSAYTQQQVLDHLERLACDGLDVTTFLSASGDSLARAVPTGTDSLPTPTWATLDPTSRLITCTFSAGCELPIEETLALEYRSEMPSNRVSDVVRHPRGIQTTREIVEADPDGTAGYLDLLASIGVGHEALVAVRTSDGDNWGAVYLVRRPGQPEFSSRELEFLRAAAPHLAEGIRRGLLLGEACDPEGPDAPAIVVLDENLTPESFTPGTQRWLQDLPAPERGDLPPAVVSVAQVALADHGAGAREPTSARVRSSARGWVMLHGQLLAGSKRRVAVTMQPADPNRITPLLLAAYGLTPREEQVTRHVLRGDSTAQIAGSLCVSPHTVQEHLKNIFAKTSARSRRELVGRLFTRHYHPRVEDNDDRVAQDRPVRGGPFPPGSRPDTRTTGQSPA